MSSWQNLDWESVLQKLESYATSSAVRERLGKTEALKSIDEAAESFAQIAEAQSVLIMGRRAYMESLDLFKIWAKRIERQGVLKPLELKDVRHFCLEALALSELLSEFSSPWIMSIKDQMMDASEPLSAIEQLLTPSGEIRNDASQKLYELDKERIQQSRHIQTTLDKLVHAQDLENILQEKYVTNREGRWVLPVRSGMQHFFDGIIHASSHTKQTVYMEPKEIIPTNNRLRQIEVEIEDEIERLLTELSKYLFSLSHQFSMTRDALEKCDLRFAQAQLATNLNGTVPEFSNDSLELISVRHPLLVLQGRDVVANDVSLDHERRLLLLSGPNAGGKTVLLKAVGLAAQMARCGLPIAAATGSRLPFFKGLVVSVGDSQSVDAEMSTFAAHLKKLNDCTLLEGSSSLILIDEICGSTDPEEGTALARSFIESYAQQKVFGVITSHLGPLKLGWTTDSGVINGSLEYNAETGRPTYRFLMGIPGQSLAIQTAKRVGVSQAIVDKAFSNLSPDLKRYLKSLEQVEAMKADILALTDQLHKQTSEARTQKQKYESLVQRFNQKQEQILARTLKQAERKVETLIDHAKVSDAFKRHETLEKMRSQLPEIVKAKPTTPQLQTLSSASEFAKAYPPGTKVFVPSIGRDAVIQGQPNAKGEVPILSNSMRLVLDWQALKPPEQGGNPTVELLRKTSHYAASPHDSDRVIDLRGHSTEEALSQLEIALDTAAACGEERVKVIHGHGTEVLKKTVRNYLSRSVYVKKWQAGSKENGGDGITWIEL